MRPAALLTLLEPAPLRIATADHALMRRILEETDVDRTPPAPSWPAYAQDLAEAALRQLVRSLGPFRDWVGSRLENVEVPALVLLIAVLVTLAYLTIRGIVRSVRHRPARPLRPNLATSPGPAPGIGTLDAVGWRRQLDARLARGDVAGALDALWWWLARSLSGPRVETSWTSRELIASAGRDDLFPLVALLDRMIYGSSRPTPSEVRRLQARLEGAVP